MPEIRHSKRFEHFGVVYIGIFYSRPSSTSLYAKVDCEIACDTGSEEKIIETDEAH